MTVKITSNISEWTVLHWFTGNRRSYHDTGRLNLAEFLSLYKERPERLAESLEVTKVFSPAIIDEEWRAMALQFIDEALTGTVNIQAELQRLRNTVKNLE